MRINTLNGSTPLDQTSRGLGPSPEPDPPRYRINKASDGASAPVATESLKSQLSGLRHAIRNSHEGLALTQGADHEGPTARALLQSAIARLQVSSENLAASESHDAATEMSVEMATYTESQRILQAGTALVPQANAVPKTILDLLR